MQNAITAGEGFDWYYADEAGRAARARLPITDGLAGKPWVYRFKDITGWWSNPHYDRVNGAEVTSPTAWVPGMKPVWFTELGCPAIDKGASRPNVFLDPKSAESARPWGSSGGRADSQQRRFLEAHFDHWQAGGPVDPAHMFLWTWDARPYPAFPENTSLWSDGANWQTGHWLNGRLGTATLADTLAAILTDHGIGDVDVSAVSGDLGGYVQGDVASARDLIEPLMDAFGIDMHEEEGTLVFRSQREASLPPVTLDVLAEEDEGPLWSETRGHDSDFASGAILNFTDAASAYETASVRSRRVAGASARLIADNLPAVVTRERAQSAVEARLREHHLARRTISLSLSPQDIVVNAGDVISIADGPSGRFMVTRVEEGEFRRIEAREYFPAAASIGAAAASRPGSTASVSGFAPLVCLLDLPHYEGSDDAGLARVGAYVRPWRRVVISASASTENYASRAILDRPAKIGALVAALQPGVAGRFDEANTMTLDMGEGDLSSVTAVDVLNGANRLAVEAQNGVWEVIGFREAVEIAPYRWRLSGLLRALGGTDDAMQAGAAIGARCIVLDDAVQPLAMNSAEAGLARNYIAEPATGAMAMAGPFSFAGGVRASTPLAPVHLRAKREATGEITLSWTRRGRLDADNWNAAEIPMDEEVLNFEVGILSGGTVLRTLSVGDVFATYAATDVAADFPTPVSTLDIRVRQIGRAVGAGLAAVRQGLRID